MIGLSGLHASGIEDKEIKEYNASEDTSVCVSAVDTDGYNFDWDGTPDDAYICVPDPEFRKFINSSIGNGISSPDAYDNDAAIKYGDISEWPHPFDLSGMKTITDLTGAGALDAKVGHIKAFDTGKNHIKSYAPLRATSSIEYFTIQDVEMTKEAFLSLEQFKNVSEWEFFGMDFQAMGLTPDDMETVFSYSGKGEFGEFPYRDEVVYRFYDNNLSQAMYDRILNTNPDLISLIAISDSPEITKINIPPGMDKLERYSIFGMYGVEEIDSLKNAPNLTNINLHEIGLTQEQFDSAFKNAGTDFPKLQQFNVSNDDFKSDEEPTLGEPTSGQYDGYNNSVYDLSLFDSFESKITAFYARNQVIKYDPITITNTPEAMSYTFNPTHNAGDMQSTEFPLVLGDNHVVSDFSWLYNPMLPPLYEWYEVDGVFIQDVYYQKGPKVTLTDYTIPEVIVGSDFTMSDSEIISALNYEVTETGSSIPGTTVELSSSMDTIVPLDIDYTKPGDNTVYFHTTNGDGMTTVESGTITVTDLLPEIKIARNQINLPIGSDEIDLIKEFNATATEIEENDLTDRITTEGNVDYDKEGIYDITFNVVDDEANPASITGKVVIEDDSTVSAPDYTVNKTSSPIGDGSATLSIGDEIDYAISMESKSDIPRGISITDPISKNLNIDTSTVKLTVDGAIVEFDSKFNKSTNTLMVVYDEAIEEGDDVELSFESTIVHDKDGVVKNTATVSTNDDSLITTKETNTTIHNLSTSSDIVVTGGAYFKLLVEGTFILVTLICVKKYTNKERFN
ncbi:MAG: immunoglobulin-like domain-containing protein [Mycoplasmatales bacterium]